MCEYDGYRTQAKEIIQMNFTTFNYFIRYGFVWCFTAWKNGFKDKEYNKAFWNSLTEEWELSNGYRAFHKGYQGQSWEHRAWYKPPKFIR